MFHRRCTILVAAALLASPLAAREIAITFDDLPATHFELREVQEVTTKLLRSLKRNRVPAIGFVNEGKLHYGGGEVAARTALLEQWLDAGHMLGNHTYSHIGIDASSFEQYAADVIRGEPVARRLLQKRGQQLRYFRHTQLRTGPTVEYKRRLDAFLRERGYTIAPVTIDNDDYILANEYAKAKHRGDRRAMKRIAAAYIPYMESVVAHFERLSVELLGYEVKQTLLLHANALNADHFDALAEMMRCRGYRFITIDEALKDPAYRSADAQANTGLSWIHRWMIAKGMEMKPEPRPAKVR